MLYSKRRFGVFTMLGLILVVMGWMTYALTGAQGASYDYASLKDPVLIQLDKEPQLQSPIRTFVMPMKQTFTLYFKESMDKDSVEAAIKRQADLYTDQHQYGFSPLFTYEWNNDQELHLTAQVTAGQQKPGEPDQSYLIDVSGSSTKSGQVLEAAPSFNALLTWPKQLWRVSVDGKVREHLTVLNKPYDTKMLDADGRYLLLSRYTEYCGCPKNYQKLYSIYDSEKQTTTPYPVELKTEYMGQGNFVIDKRGFFYIDPPATQQVPEREEAVTIDVLHHVHGAAFSKDRKFVVMVVENEALEDTHDFVVHDLTTGHQQAFSMVVRGVGDKKSPIRFTDDGESVYFTMQDSASGGSTYKELGYQYSWKTKQLKPWVSPVGKAHGVFYSASGDGIYRVYSDGGIYKGKDRISEENIGLKTGYWLPGTHLLADIHIEGKYGPVTDMERNLVLYNADHHNYVTLIKGLTHSTQVVGASSDAKWIYLTSDADLKAQGQ